MVVIIGLGCHSVYEFYERYHRPNPFDQPQVGVPALQEGPFDPARGGIRKDLLPWILDPAGAWPALGQAKTREQLVRAARARYPAWGTRLAAPRFAADGALLVERHRDLDLVVTPEGLVLRVRH